MEIMDIKESFEKQAIANSLQLWPDKLIDILLETLSSDQTKRPPALRLKAKVDDVIKTIEKVSMLEKETPACIYSFFHSKPKMDDKVKNGNKYLKERSILFLHGVHGNGKMTSALQIGCTLRQEGYITMVFNMDGISNWSETYRELIQDLRRPLPENENDFSQVASDALCELQKSGYKLFCIFRNCNEPTIKALQAIEMFRKCFGSNIEGMKVIFISDRCLKSNQYSIHFDGNSHIVDNFIKLSDSQPAKEAENTEVIQLILKEQEE